MAPKAGFQVANPGDEAAVCEVRVTHYREMKGKDEMNIRRWVMQVAKPDGTPSAPKDAAITETDLGDVKLTVVQLDGAIGASMRGGGSATPGQRLVAAIVDHPKGPHFVKITGPVKAMEGHKAAINASLRSAKVAEG